MMADGSLQHRILRIALLDPIGDALALLRRLQSNEMFQRYLRERSLHALPLVAAVAIAGLALAWGTMAFIGHAGTFLAVLTAMVSALCVLAGSLLVLGAPRSPLLLQLLPFLKGLTLLFWATATWWIPMLVILGVWRHGVERFPLRYDPLYWGAVFPLGMYTACTWRLSQAIDVPSLAAIPRVFIFIALFAWTLTFAGLAARLAGGLRRSAPDG